MKTLALVCALAIAATTSVFVVVVVVAERCESSEDLQPHRSSLIGCRDKHRHIRHLMKEMGCKPRYTLVKLIPQPGYVYYPDYVPVMRCGGSCPTAMSCMPTANQTKRIAVRMDDYYSSNCYHVHVEEHLECKCDCSVRESDCSPQQVYSQDNCACECKDRQDCDQARHMIWDEKMCKCKCNREEECSSGLVWVPDLCGCAIVMEMPSRAGK